MASVYHLISNADCFYSEIIEENSRLYIPLRNRHFSAVIIQRVFRGFLVRKEIAMWNEQATVIQRYFRGWLVRWHLPEYLEAYFQRLRLKFYNLMATKIQALWRGYLVRKKMPMSISETVAYKARVKLANENMQSRMREAFANIRQGGLAGKSPEEIAALELECKNWVLFILFKTHHLLRTQTKEGIYSLHGKKELSTVEKWMKMLPMTGYMKRLRKVYEARITNSHECVEYMFTSRKMRKYEDAMRLRDKSRDVSENKTYEDKCIHDKRFDLYKKPNGLQYERQILLSEKYSSRIPTNPRTLSTHSVTTDFNSFSTKATADPHPPNYYIDFWNEKCTIHNFKDK